MTVLVLVPVVAHVLVNTLVREKLILQHLRMVMIHECRIDKLLLTTMTPSRTRRSLNRPPTNDSATFISAVREVDREVWGRLPRHGGIDRGN